MIGLKSIAIALGGEVSGNRVVAPGPNHSKKDRSLSVSLSMTAPDGLLIHSYSGDDWQLCKDYVRGKLGFPDFAPGRREEPRRIERPKPVEPAGPDDSEFARIKQALRIWREAVDPRGTLAEEYLKSRRLELPFDISGRILRFHADCPFGEGERHPCMVALMRNISSDEPTGIQRTKLPHVGRGPDRRMLGVARGAAIKIDPDENVTMGLAIGEGLETVLTARQKGLRPVWALGSAGAIASFPVLGGVDALSILAERDENGANARAVEECGQRWFDAKREVTIFDPKCGNDLNDALMGAAE